jgi:hypothetical protein
MTRQRNSNTIVVMVGLAAVLAVVLLALRPPAAHARAAYVLVQREGTSVSRLTLAPSGLRFDSLAPEGHGRRAKALLGVIIAYRGPRLMLLDPVHRTYQSLSLASALSSYRSELQSASQGQPSVKLPPPPRGAAPGRSAGQRQASALTPPARLRALSLRTRIGPFLARAYLLQQGPLRERLWYADALPGPPARVRSVIAGVLSGSGSLGRALGSRDAQIPLRIDVPASRHWRTSLRTLSIRRRSGPGVAVRAPRGYRRGALLQSQGLRSRSAIRAKTASVPGAPIRCGVLLITGPLGCSLGLGVGPVSEHPAIWAFYWGRRFAGHLDFVSAMNDALQNFVGDQFADPISHNFWGPLGQYGVHRGKFLGYDIVNEKPDSSIGSWNVFDIEWFVLSHRFGSDAPNYWWRWSDEDPIFAIFVDSSDVDSSSWDGYHFFTPTAGLLFSFLVHPYMPWFIVKVPSLDSLPTNRSSAAFKQALDTATERASHEFVEAATDPYPFISWADPLKEPIWEEGEIADICSQGSTAPWSKATRLALFSTAFSTYWSNADQACVPESRPTLQLALPGDGQSFGFHTPVTFIAHSDDLFDNGPVANSQIEWDSDGHKVGSGSIFTTSTLESGTHQITVTAEDSQGASRVAGPVTIHIFPAQPPTVKLNLPADGATFGLDQTVDYRGSAFDPQDGDLGASATWSVDGAQVGTGATLFQYRIPTQGTHTVTLSVTDSAQLSASASITVHVGPATGKPTVTITTPADGTNFAVGQPITFTANATAPGGATVPDSGYRWSDDIDGPLGTGKTITHMLTGSPCEIIDHRVTVTATDSFGGSASDTITVNDGSIC